MSGDPVGDFIFGDDDVPRPKERVRNGGRLDLTEVMKFFEQGGMSEAHAAVALLGISQAGKDLLNGGLTREGLLLLIQTKAGYVKGNLIAATTIEKVLNAVATLDSFVDREALAAALKGRKKEKVR